MAKKISNTDKMASREQIAVLQNLKQQTASWLLGVNGRSLRDDPHLPRNRDGSYDARALLDHASSKAPTPNFNDDTMETFLQAVEGVFNEVTMSKSIYDFLRFLDDEFGDAGLAVFVRKGLEWFPRSGLYPKGYIPSLTEKDIREQISKRIEEEIRCQVNEQRVDELQAVHICKECRKIRRGRKWVKGNVPRDIAEVLDLCPDCEAKLFPRNHRPA